MIVTHSLARYRLSEELAGDHDNAACYEERDWPFVEQFECEVIYGNLEDNNNNVYSLDMISQTSPMPRMASVAPLISPTVVAMLRSVDIDQFWSENTVEITAIR